MAGNTEYKNKFAAEKYDRVGLMLPKGKKEQLKKHAEQNGDKSLNAFINSAIDEAVERDNKKIPE